MASIKILCGTSAGRVVELDAAPAFVGRAETNTVRLTDPGVSSRHAKLWVDDGQWWVMDLGSTNGTLVNDADIDREPLRDGDRIAFGPIVGVFQAAASDGVIARPPGEITTLRARIASLEQELERVRAESAASEKRAAESAAAASRDEIERLRALVRQRDEVRRQKELSDLTILDGAIHSSQPPALDWEARYRSQQEELESLRHENAALRTKADALERELGSLAPATASDDAPKADARADALQDMTSGVLEALNDAVSLLRRNAEVLQGYVQDCALLAACVRRIDYTRLEPEQQRMVRELVDETQPDVVVRNMEGLGEQNVEATARAKRLLLDALDALRPDEGATDLERCLAQARALLPESDVRVKVAGTLPALSCSQPEGVLFAWALLVGARRLCAESTEAPVIRADAEGQTITLQVAPLDPGARDRLHDALGGAGDARMRFLVAFVRHTCGGRVDVRDVGGRSTLFLTFRAGG